MAPVGIGRLWLPAGAPEGDSPISAANRSREASKALFAAKTATVPVNAYETGMAGE